MTRTCITPMLKFIVSCRHRGRSSNRHWQVSDSATLCPSHGEDAVTGTASCYNLWFRVCRSRRWSSNKIKTPTPGANRPWTWTCRTTVGGPRGPQRKKYQPVARHWYRSKDTNVHQKSASANTSGRNCQWYNRRHQCFQWVPILCYFRTKLTYHISIPISRYISIYLRVLEGTRRHFSIPSRQLFSCQYGTVLRSHSQTRNPSWLAGAITT